MIKNKNENKKRKQIIKWFKLKKKVRKLLEENTAEYFSHLSMGKNFYHINKPQKP